MLKNGHSSAIPTMRPRRACWLSCCCSGPSRLELPQPLTCRRRLPLAARAAEIDDSDPWAHLALGWVAFMMRRTETAVEEYQRALDINPNFAAAHGHLGMALGLGRPERPGDRAFGTGDPDEPARSADLPVQCESRHRPLSRRPLCRSRRLRPQGGATAAGLHRRPSDLRGKPGAGRAARGSARGARTSSRNCSPTSRSPGSRRTSPTSPMLWPSWSPACARRDWNRAGNQTKNWSGRRDSNPRPRPWQGRALPLSYTRIREAWRHAPPSPFL